MQTDYANLRREEKETGGNLCVDSPDIIIIADIVCWLQGLYFKDTTVFRDYLEGEATKRGTFNWQCRTQSRNFVLINEKMRESLTSSTISRYLEIAADFQGRQINRLCRQRPSIKALW